MPQSIHRADLTITSHLTVFGKVGRLASEDVVLRLVNSKCMPVLLYAAEVCPLSQ